MAQPVAYVPVTSFIGYQGSQPWFPGQNIDIELQALKSTTDQIRTNLALIQRDDGLLANGVVTFNSLSPTLQTAWLAQSVVPGNALVVGTASFRPLNEAAYTIVTLDNNNLIVSQNTTTLATWTLPLFYPFRVTVRNNGVVPLTITSSTARIDGQANLMIAPGQSSILVSDGTNYDTVTPPNNQHDLTSTAVLVGSYTPYTSGIGVTVDGTVTVGNIVGFDYSWVGQATIQFRHTMAAGDTIKTAILDLLAQFKANALVNAAVGFDYVSYAVAYQTSATAWHIEIPESWPFVVNTPSTITSFASGGASATVTVRTSAGNALAVGAGIIIGHACRVQGRAPRIGDGIGGIYFGTDTTNTNFSLRDGQPAYCQIQATVVDPADGVFKGALHFIGNQLSLEGITGVIGGGNFGVGTIAPKSPIHVNRNATLTNPVIGASCVLQLVNVDGATTAIELQSYGTGQITGFLGAAARGTAAAPTALQSGDIIVDFAANGHDGVAFSGNQATIVAATAQIWSAGNHGTYLAFSTTPLASTTLTEAVRIQPSGALVVGITADVGTGYIGVRSGITIGLAGTATGQLQIYGTTSGNVTQTVQAAAGTPTVTWGTGSGTPVVSASAPFTVNATTGNLSATTTGTGSTVVLQTSPSLVTPALGVATATSINKLTLTQPATGSTLTIADGLTLSYDQSTWTPTIVGSGTAGTPTYTVQQGTYEKIGRTVIVRFSLTISALGGATGNIIVGGLPFTAGNIANNYGGCSINAYVVSALAAGAAGLVGFVTPNTTQISINQSGNAGTSALTVTQAGASLSIFGWAVYNT